MRSRAPKERAVDICTDPGDLARRAEKTLARTRSDLAELRRRGVLRTGNAPAGDCAEWLICRAGDGQLGPNSHRRWGVLTAEGQRIQVKARIVTATRLSNVS